MGDIIHRQQLIKKMICSKKVQSFKNIFDQIDCSIMTIRRDINCLRCVTSYTFDSVIPKRSSNVIVMGRGSAEETIVVVKPKPSEGAVTYPRIKVSVRDMDVKGEGWNMLLYSVTQNNCRYEFSH